MAAVPRFGGILALSVLCAGCVVGSPRPEPRLSVARAPASRVGPDAILPPASGCRGAEEHERPPRPTKDAVWIEGYCHFAVTHYTWVEGSWRTR
jgi:hypothetical protein